MSEAHDFWHIKHKVFQKILAYTHVFYNAARFASKASYITINIYL